MHTIRTSFLAAALAAVPAVAAAQPATPAAMPSETPAPAPTPPPAADATPPTEPAAPPPEATPVVAQAEPAAAPMPTEAVAVEESAPAVHWYDTLQVNGFASIAYSYNANRPAGEANGLRVFDSDDGSINVDVIEVVVQKPVAAPGDAGFRVDLEAGSTIPAASASAGLFRDADGNAQDFDLQQAYVSYIAKVGKGLRIDAGKFITHMGYEVIEGYDGYNDNYSRSVLFGYAIPFTHTGAKLSYPLTDKVSGMLMVANGWDNVKDNNDGKTLGAQVSAVLGPATAYLNYVGGPEQAGEDGNWRHVVDVVGIVKATDQISLGVNGDFGYEKDAVMTGDATWYGAALYGKYAFTDAVSLALRGEIFDDADGARTGAAQTVVEGTLTPAVKVSDNLVIRADLRLDRSDVESFETNDSMSKNQFTVAINALGIL